jgi:hypothetical protein
LSALRVSFPRPCNVEPSQTLALSTVKWWISINRYTHAAG